MKERSITDLYILLYCSDRDQYDDGYHYIARRALVGVRGSRVCDDVAYDAVGYVKRFNLLKNAAWQLLIMSGICVLWDLGTGWRGWSVNIGIPDICLLIQVVMLIISRIRSLSPREYMIYYVMAAVYSMILPLILLVTGVIHYRTPSVICIGCSFLLLIGLILFKRKEFKEEMHKKFHVG